MTDQASRRRNRERRRILRGRLEPLDFIHGPVETEYTVTAAGEPAAVLLFEMGKGNFEEVQE
jgi:hypothetical protein